MIIFTIKNIIFIYLLFFFLCFFKLQNKTIPQINILLRMFKIKTVSCYYL